MGLCDLLYHSGCNYPCSYQHLCRRHSYVSHQRTVCKQGQKRSALDCQNQWEKRFLRYIGLDQSCKGDGASEVRSGKGGQKVYFYRPVQVPFSEVDHHRVDHSLKCHTLSILCPHAHDCSVRVQHLHQRSCCWIIFFDSLSLLLLGHYTHSQEGHEPGLLCSGFGMLFCFAVHLAPEKGGSLIWSGDKHWSACPLLHHQLHHHS